MTKTTTPKRTITDQDRTAIKNPAQDGINAAKRDAAAMRKNTPARLVDTIHAEWSKRGQWADFTELATLGAHRLRVRVHADSHRDQGFARVERWDGDAWREVWELDPRRMNTASDLGYQNTISGGDFVEDRNTLIERAIQILKG